MRLLWIRNWLETYDLRAHEESNEADLTGRRTSTVGTTVAVGSVVASG
jgi:hypothetical protein